MARKPREKTEADTVEGNGAAEAEAKDMAQAEAMMAGTLPAPAKSYAQRAIELEGMGLPEAAVMAALNAEFGGAPAPASQAPATPGQPGDQIMGPDPGMVAAYAQRMQNYKKPVLRKRVLALDSEDMEFRFVVERAVKAHAGNMRVDQRGAMVDAICDALEGFGGFELPVLFFEWLQRWRVWMSAARRLPPDELVPESTLLEAVVRFHWHHHPVERAVLQAQVAPQASGPAATFNPKEGDWRA